MRKLRASIDHGFRGRFDPTTDTNDSQRRSHEYASSERLRKEIHLDSISNRPLRASGIGAGGVGQAAADNYKWRFRLPGMVQSLLGPELCLYVSGPCYLYGCTEDQSPDAGRLNLR